MSTWKYTALFIGLLIFPFTRQLLFLLFLIYLMYQWLRPTLQPSGYRVYCPPKWSPLRAPYLWAFWTSFGALAKKKGRVTQQDIQIAQSLLKFWNLVPAEVQTAKSAFYVGKGGGWSVELIFNLKRKLLNQPHLQEMFWMTLLWTCAQKGAIQSVEWSFLKEIGSILDLDDRLIRRSKEKINASEEWSETARRARHYGGEFRTGQDGWSTRMDTAKACEILGVPHGASFSEIKRAYRQLAHHYHPDKLIHQHLSPSEKAEATERLLNIQKAYAHLKAQHEL